MTTHGLSRNGILALPVAMFIWFWPLTPISTEWYSSVWYSTIPLRMAPLDLACVATTDRTLGGWFSVQHKGALPLSSPTPPAFSTTQPEHALGPNTDTETLLKFTTQHLTGVIISNKVSNESIFPLR